MKSILILDKHLEYGYRLNIVNSDRHLLGCIWKSDGDTSLFDCISSGNAYHAALIGLFIDEALNKAKSEGKTIQAVAVSSGPGRTPDCASCFRCQRCLLRTNVSADRHQDTGPHHSSHSPQQQEGLPLLSMIDARRMEVYAAVYDNCLNEIRATQAYVVTADTYASFLKIAKYASS